MRFYYMPTFSLFKNCSRKINVILKRKLLIQFLLVETALFLKYQLLQIN
jgi:hypothetical protein